MTIPVQAWRVGPNSMVELPWPLRIQWNGWNLVKPLLRPGDWIVQTRYGLEAMTDEQFRACCTEVGDDA